MKIKYLVKSFFAIAFMMTMALSFTSCTQNNDDENLTVITYVAEGSLSDSSGDMGALFAISSYSEAISKVMGSSMYLTKEKDSEVIKACDAVFQKQRNDYPAMKGHVEIKRVETKTEGKGSTDVVIKTYKYE